LIVLAGFGVYQLERLEQQLAAAKKGVEVQLEADKTVELGEPLVVRALNLGCRVLSWLGRLIVLTTIVDHAFSVAEIHQRRCNAFDVVDHGDHPALLG
jgi:hypothetical protein